MKTWLLKNPGGNGLILGPLVLGLIRLPPAAYFAWSNHGESGFYSDFQFVMMWVFGGFFWGLILGGPVGEAYAAWCEGDPHSARRLCLKYGYISGGTILMWMVLASLALERFSTAFGGKYDIWTAVTYLGFYFVVNTNFQACLLLVLAGGLLSRRAGQTVQVSEKLRL